MGLLDLFEERQKIYPARVKGTYRRLKWILMAVFLGLYYVLPFIRWPRGPYLPDQAVLVDIPGRKFYFFFFEVWPQEVVVFTGLLLLGAFALFFFTSILGRVWCGFACPQTVWTDLYLAVERWVEGDRNSRKRLDDGPLGKNNKLVKKIVKHSLWILIALCTGGAWVLYFTDAPTLLLDLFQFKASFASIFWIGALTLSTYTLAGFAREQVCTYMCPYARFQGAMYDDKTLLVTYEDKRGEPRGKLGTEGAGDCIDCMRCVNVCPVGIDIREGQQYQCINCGLCVDACNEIMTRINKPLGLIRYDTLQNVNTGKHIGLGDVFNFLKHPRPLIYATIISAVGLALLYTLTLGRVMLDINVIRERNPMYVQMSDGSVRNIYTVHVVNKSHELRTYDISVENLEGALLSLARDGAEKSKTVQVNVRPDKVGTFRIFLDVPNDAWASGSSPVEFTIKGPYHHDSYESTFVAPEEF